MKNGLMWLVLLTLVPGSSMAGSLFPVDGSDEIEALHDQDSDVENNLESAVITDEKADELSDEGNSAESTVKIREIRDYLAKVDASQTCLDEYLQRRKQLIVKLSLTPLTLPLTVATSAMGLGFLGSRIGAMYNPPGGWGDLAGLAAGLMYGGLGSLIYTGTDRVMDAIKLHRLNLVLKTLGEQYLGRSGTKTDAFYEFYLKKAKGETLEKSELISKLLESDRNGALCDGSMLKKRKIRIGSRLKFKVANAKDFVKFLNRQ